MYCYSVEQVGHMIDAKTELTLPGYSVAGLEGVRVVCLNPLLGPNYFNQFHGKMYEKTGKMLKTYPLLMDLNPTSRNPGSTPVITVISKMKIYFFFQPCLLTSQTTIQWWTE